MDKVLNQREINQEHKQRMFEAKLTDLTHQLELERQRRRSNFQSQLINKNNQSTNLLNQNKISRGRSQKLVDTTKTSTQQKAPFRV